MLKINENAIFISDSHFNKQRDILHALLLKIQSKELITPQIYLMGDIFDFLAKEITYFINQNKKVINLINKLSNKIEIIYFEGNHDYNLDDIFPNITIIPREKQPLNIRLINKNISLSHGDIFTPKGYDIYCKIIRNHALLTFLNFIDINNWLTKKIEANLAVKNICHKQKNFNKFIEKRVDLYNTDLIIEGHFHQGYIDEKYINLPSLYCTNQYMIYQNNQFTFNVV